MARDDRLAGSFLGLLGGEPGKGIDRVGLRTSTFGAIRGSPEVWVASCRKVIPPLAPAARKRPTSSSSRSVPSAASRASSVAVIVLVTEPISSRPSAGVPAGLTRMTAPAPSTQGSTKSTGPTIISAQRRLAIEALYQL